MGKKTAFLTSPSEPSPPATRKAWLPWNGSEQRLKSLLRSLLEGKHITLTELARRLKVPPAHVSRWLKDLEGADDQLPLGILFQIARELNQVVVIGLVEGREGADEKLHLPTPPLLREFFLGMACSVNPSEGPSGVARHIAEVFGAKSWTMYTEDPRRNVLEMTGRGPRLRDPELMFGPSFASELPTQVLQEVEMSRWSPTAEQPASRKSFVERDWDEEAKQRSGQDSSFAKREKVGYCMGVPIVAEGLRTTVLFLNFDKKPAEEVRDPDVVATAANELRGLVQQVWPTPRPSGTMQRGDLAFSQVLDVLDPAFAFGGGEALDEQTQLALRNCCQALWPGMEKVCTVHSLLKSVPYVGEPKTPIAFVGPEPDDMVRRAATRGENFFVPDLAQDEVRARFDERNRIHRSKVQKLVVPIRAEDFLDAGEAVRPAVWRSEAKDSQRVLQVHAPHKSQVRTWGAVNVETTERFLLQANALELCVLAHLAAGAFAIRRNAAEEGAPRSYYEPLFNACAATIRNLRKSCEQRTSADTSAALDPLDPLCQAVVDSRLLTGIERCAIYPFDHVYGQFRKGGSYIDPEWTASLGSWAPDNLVDRRGKVKYLEPRKGGNSERMLGVVDEYHIITDAANHPRVSPVTKMMGTVSLIGCSCRIGASLRSDAVLWLGSRQHFKPDYLEAKGYAMLKRLRVVAQVAAMFCVALRWWSPDDDWAGTVNRT